MEKKIDLINRFSICSTTTLSGTERYILKGSLVNSESQENEKTFLQN